MKLLHITGTYRYVTESGMLIEHRPDATPNRRWYSPAFGFPETAGTLTELLTILKGYSN